MAKREYIQRHLLVIKKLKNKPCNFEEIRKYLLTQQEITGDNFDISQRTFQRDVKEISTIYGIEIKYNKKEFESGDKLYTVPDDLQEAKKSLVAYAEQNDGAHSKKVTIREEYLKPIRNKYLHRSASDSLGKGGRYKDGKPYRKHHDG